MVTTRAVDNLDRHDVDPSMGCWVWNGYIESDGYGRVQVDYVKRQAHILIYELLVGLVPEGLELDHLCRNRTCVNPDHLEPVTTAENQRRGDAAKLTWDDVHFVRDNYIPRDPEYGLRPLARRFCVTHTVLNKIVHNKAWVDDPALVGG
jgi:hypothetical protein